MTADPKKDPDWEKVNVELPIRYWVVTLGMIESFFKETVVLMIKDARAKGLTEDQFPREKRTIVVGTLATRAAVVSALVKAGAMKPESEGKWGQSMLRGLWESGKQIRKDKQNGQH